MPFDWYYYFIYQFLLWKTKPSSVISIPGSKALMMILDVKQCISNNVFFGMAYPHAIIAIFIELNNHNDENDAYAA